MRFGNRRPFYGGEDVNLSIIFTVSIIPAYPITLKNVVDRGDGGFSVNSNQ
ncbi:MAG: hypothetical protein GPI90_22835 [Microcystis aeruginosa K13-05]|uniref:hypothetical protein n=1 Tax=unclassified Microcystis TaxID=2643300 RepID=UPI0022BD7B28|nr:MULTISPECIES: hypothetical protein [unclassified Microcystis]MCZ8048222.1 hypothetical protein [Microcystis sp. LE19-41.2A]MCZ8288985.1 hypothetical protein [Microcystis sp. LE19-59.1C]NCR82581.1 hypothetical protein [Microcystis aeruginosa K13-10]NCR87271.1 hypothetical protein [Microcystis aeruginosa K13-05]